MAKGKSTKSSSKKPAAKKTANARKPRRKKPETLGLTARTSVASSQSLMDRLLGYMSDSQAISALFPFQMYEVMRNLFLTEPYFSRLQENVLGLGNQGHELEIDAPTEQKALKALQVCNDLAARIHPESGGSDGLINGLLTQCVRMGGVFCEVEPVKNLSELRRAWLLKMETARYRYDSEGQYQICQIQSGKVVSLNPVQTVLLAAKQTDFDNPYPVPPAITALKACLTKQEFFDSVQQYLKKVSSLGIVHAEMDLPPTKGNEDYDSPSYKARCQKELNDAAANLANSIKNGVMATFSGNTLHYYETTSSAVGAEAILRIVLRQLFAGLGSDPSLFGHSDGTTETYAQVMFRILCAQIRSYLRIIKRAWEHYLRLELTLKGMGDVGVSCSFNLKDVLDEFQAAEAEMMVARTVQDDYLHQIANLEEVRQLRGYEESSAKSGSYVATFNSAQNVYRLNPRPVMGRGFNHHSTDKRSKGASDRRGFTPSNSSGSRNPVILTSPILNVSRREAEAAARQYLREVQSQLNQASRNGIQAIIEWARSHKVPDRNQFVREVIDRLFDGAESSLDEATLRRIAQEHISTIYEHYRLDDDELFRDWDEDSRGVGITLGQLDYQAIDYFGRVDSFYLGKYLSRDERHATQLRKWIERNVAEGFNPTDRQQLRQFEKDFEPLVQRIGLASGKRIISTSVSRAQNYGSCLTLSERQVTTYRWSGVWDKLTCAYCYAMQGKEFSVEKDAERIRSIIADGREDIAELDPFLTSRFARKEGLEELRSLSADEIQATGLALAPAHPECRHRVIAVYKALTNRRFDGNNLDYSPVGLVYLTFPPPDPCQQEWRIAA